MEFFWYNTPTLYFSQTLPLRLENWITSVRECKEERYYRGLQLKIIHFYFKSNEMEKVQIFFYKYFQFPGGKSHTCLIIYFQLKAEIFQKNNYKTWILNFLSFGRHLENIFWVSFINPIPAGGGSIFLRNSKSIGLRLLKFCDFSEIHKALPLGLNPGFYTNCLSL